MDWFLYGRELHHERVKNKKPLRDHLQILIVILSKFNQIIELVFSRSNDLWGIEAY